MGCSFKPICPTEDFPVYDNTFHMFSGRPKWLEFNWAGYRKFSQALKIYDKKLYDEFQTEDLADLILCEKLAVFIKDMANSELEEEEWWRPMVQIIRDSGGLQYMG